MAQKITVQIDQLAKKKDQLEARLDNLRSRQIRIEKAKETRRLVLAGMGLLKMCGGDWRKVGKHLKDAQILTLKDGPLFNEP